MTQKFQSSQSCRIKTFKKKKKEEEDEVVTRFCGSMLITRKKPRQITTADHTDLKIHTDYISDYVSIFFFQNYKVKRKAVICRCWHLKQPPMLCMSIYSNKIDKF